MLFPSTLLISSSKIDFLPYLKPLGHNQITNNPDIYHLFETSEFTIENIRHLRNFLSKKPYNHQTKIIIIENADQLNVESQNALLKTLEDPADNNYFILTTAFLGKLLPTIISRCQVIRLNKSTPQITGQPLVFPSSISQSLQTADSLYRDKNSLLNYLQNQISVYQQLLITNPSSDNVIKINRLTKCYQMLQANVEPRACLDFLLLS